MLNPTLHGSLQTAKTAAKVAGVAPGGTGHGLGGPARAWRTEAETEARLSWSHWWQHVGILISVQATGVN